MSAKQKDVVSSPAHDQNFFMQVFFRLGETFFANFLNVSKGSPSFFSLLCKECMLKNYRRPPFTFFGTMRLTGDQKIFRKKIRKKIQNSDLFFNFLLTRVL